VKPGEIIRERDVEWMSVQANRLTRTSVLDSATLVGMSPRRTIRAQDVIRSTDLQVPVMVTKNSLVTIRLRTERMELTAQGRALEEGAEGDVVRVMNTKSNTVVNAVVVDSGAVVVVPTRITAQR
jgi:flagella basal body P-ring formation protein FlgA